MFRAIGVGWLEGAGPHDLHSVAQRVARLLEELRPAVLIGQSVGTPVAALAAAISLRTTKANVVGMVLSNSGANTKGHGDVESIIERILANWGPELWKAMTERSLGIACPPELVEAFTTYPRRITAQAAPESLRSFERSRPDRHAGSVVVHSDRNRSWSPRSGAQALTRAMPQ